MHPESSTSLKIYLVFLFLVVMVAGFRLVKVWAVALPFRAGSQNANRAYLALLKSSAASLKRWMVLTSLAWGLFTSTNLYRLCDRLLDDNRVGSLLVVFLVREFSSIFSLTILVALFAFLAQCHLSSRIQGIENS